MERGLTLREMSNEHRLIDGKPTFPFHCDKCGTYTKHYYPSLECVCCGTSAIKIKCFNCRYYNKESTHHYKCYTDIHWCIANALENVKGR